MAIKRLFGRLTFKVIWQGSSFKLLINDGSMFEINANYELVNFII